MVCRLSLQFLYIKIFKTNRRIGCLYVGPLSLESYRFCGSFYLRTSYPGKLNGLCYRTFVTRDLFLFPREQVLWYTDSVFLLKVASHLTCLTWSFACYTHFPYLTLLPKIHSLPLSFTCWALGLRWLSVSFLDIL